jgi:hypothetical protein
MNEDDFNQQGLGFAPLAIAAGAIPMITELISAFKKPKKEKPKGPSPAEIAAMERAAAAERQAAMYKKIGIGAGVVAVLAIGGVIAYKVWKKRKR